MRATMVTWSKVLQLQHCSNICDEQRVLSFEKGHPLQGLSMQEQHQFRAQWCRQLCIQQDKTVDECFL